MNAVTVSSKHLPSGFFFHIPRAKVHVALADGDVPFLPEELFDARDSSDLAQDRRLPAGIRGQRMGHERAANRLDATASPSRSGVVSVGLAAVSSRAKQKRLTANAQGSRGNYRRTTDAAEDGRTDPRTNGPRNEDDTITAIAVGPRLLPVLLFLLLHASTSLSLRPELPQPLRVGHRQRHEIHRGEMPQAAVQAPASRRTPSSRRAGRSRKPTASAPDANCGWPAGRACCGRR